MTTLVVGIMCAFGGATAGVLMMAIACAAGDADRKSMGPYDPDWRSPRNVRRYHDISIMPDEGEYLADHAELQGLRSKK